MHVSFSIGALELFSYSLIYYNRMESLNQLTFKQSAAVKGSVPRKRAEERASVERLTKVAARNVRVINENAKIR